MPKDSDAVAAARENAQLALSNARLATDTLGKRRWVDLAAYWIERVEAYELGRVPIPQQPPKEVGQTDDLIGSRKDKDLSDPEKQG